MCYPTVLGRGSSDSRSQAEPASSGEHRPLSMEQLHSDEGRMYQCVLLQDSIDSGLLESEQATGTLAI